jgi:hypothetical protein
MSLRDAVEALREDMAQHQRHTGKLPTDSRNQTLAVDAIIELEKRSADVTPPPAEVATTPVVATVERKEVDGKTYIVDRGPDAPMFRAASQFESEVLARATPRLELLLSKRESGPLGTPSWSARVMAAMFFKVKSLEARAAKLFDLAENYERAYQLDLSELLESSNQTFGDWRKTAERPLVVASP